MSDNKLLIDNTPNALITYKLQERLTRAHRCDLLTVVASKVNVSLREEYTQRCGTTQNEEAEEESISLTY